MWTRDSTFSGGTSSAGAGEVATASRRSTPTRRRRPSRAEIDKVRSLTRRAQHPNARRPAAPAQPGAAGLVQLLSARRVLADLQLPGPLRLPAGVRVAGEEASRAEHAHPGPSVSPRLDKIRDGAVEMFRPQRIAIERYRYRGARIPTPWTSAAPASPAMLA